MVDAYPAPRPPQFSPRPSLVLHVELASDYPVTTRLSPSPCAAERLTAICVLRKPLVDKTALPDSTRIPSEIPVFPAKYGSCLQLLAKVVLLA